MTGLGDDRPGKKRPTFVRPLLSPDHDQRSHILALRAGRLKV